MEWSFFVTEDALTRLQPKVGHDNASLLLAFDANRVQNLCGGHAGLQARAERII